MYSVSSVHVTPLKVTVRLERIGSKISVRIALSVAVAAVFAFRTLFEAF